jgi:hypothetical protein
MTPAHCPEGDQEFEPVSNAEREAAKRLVGRKRSDAAKKAAKTRAAQKHARELYERDLNVEPAPWSPPGLPRS